VMEYGLVQVPIFGCMILGNIVLSLIIKTKELATIANAGFAIIGVSLVLLAVLPWIWGENIWLLIGPFCLYTFGLGLFSGPITRITLFSTEIAKGTASAFLAFSGFVLQGSWVALAPLVYANHRNVSLGLLCLASFVLALACAIWAFFLKRSAVIN
jgi:DHA1 family multidrug/chloramphenicol efflux transport protein-like MFS transporter